MKKLLVFLALIINAYADLYDVFYGNPIEGDQSKYIDPDSDESFCIMNVKPCDSNEPRRIDGTCNNLDSPVRGSSHTPYVRLLPAKFGEDFKPRKTKSGKDYKQPRVLRTGLLLEGRQSDPELTILATHLMVFVGADQVSQQDTTSYMFERNCCGPEGKYDDQCAPHMIPDDDPVHQFSGIRCLNMTIPQTFQLKGCLAQGTTPERIISATPLLDLSQLYGFSNERLTQKMRDSSGGGRLREEVEDGKIWPPTTSPDEKNIICYMNEGPSETRCHDGAGTVSNSLFGINLFTIWSWRQHNLIAKALAKVNACWDDDKLFYTARDINIAMYLQIYFYELLPILMGKERLINDGVLSCSNGFRDIYNSSITSQISVEHTYFGRWAHAMQEGTLKMFDKDGTYINKVPITETTFKTAYVCDHIEGLTQGAFRQCAAGVDTVVDPNIAEKSLGNLQGSSDLLAQDLGKGRLLGISSYADYKRKLEGKVIRSWDDLQDIHPRSIEALKTHYECVEDIEALAGAWLEVPQKGSYTPPLIYSIAVEQFQRIVGSDRHWFEREHRPNAFTYDQLQEIRKRTIAAMLCDVGDSVTNIQPSAFKKAGPNNEMVECCELPQFDYQKWKDPACECAQTNDL